MKNLYLLPTGKESKLFEDFDNGTFAFSKEAIRWRGEQYLNYHIYITSSTDKSQGYYISTEGDMCIFKPPFHPKEHHEKIILTSDPSLVGVQQIEDKLLKWFVQNPKCEWVEVEKEYKNWYVSGLLAPDMKLNYKIIIPKKEPKQETIEEAAKNYSIGWGQCDDKKAFIAGAKWQQERDYELIDRYVDDVMGGCNLKFEDWLNR